MDQMNRIKHLPGVLIHGRLDISSPLETPWLLHRAWPGSRLVILDEGHGGEQMIEQVMAAIADLG
jgi:proline iminopeptidase